MEIQRELAKRNASVSPEIRIEFRIGIHVGDIIVDVMISSATAVNIAARLERIAQPGGISISDDAYRQIRGKIDVVFDDVGLQAL